MISVKDKTTFSIALIIVGFGAGLLATRYQGLRQILGEDSSEVRGGSNYTYINPLLECDLGSEYVSKNAIRPFKPLLDDTIGAETDAGRISYAAVYFHDLNNGSWFGINSTDKFRPASLLKVPLMLNILKLEERNPGILAKQIKYSGADLQLNQAIKPAQALVLGKTYSVDELLNYMIKYSDNKATAELLNLVDDHRLEELFQILGIEVPKNNTGQDDFLTLRQYSSFFRILFNSSYLSYDLSEKALSILAGSTFDQGLRGGVSREVVIAHKFGESTDENTNQKQLHDCGIVYYPKKQYLLCVSVRGTDFVNMEKAVQDISRETYNEVDRQVKGE